MKNAVLSKKVGAVPLIVLVALSTVVGVYAGIMITKNINMAMRVKQSVSLGVFDIDHTTELTFIQLGDFTWDQQKSLPALKETGPWYYINNTDQMDLYISFTEEGLPENTLLIYWVKRGDKTTWKRIDMGQAPYEYPLLSPSLNPDKPLETFAYLVIECLTLFDVPFGDYTPILHIHGCDSPSG